MFWIVKNRNSFKLTYKGNGTNVHVCTLNHSMIMAFWTKLLNLNFITSTRLEMFITLVVQNSVRWWNMRIISIRYIWEQTSSFSISILRCAYLSCINNLSKSISWYTLLFRGFEFDNKQLLDYIKVVDDMCPKWAREIC